MMKPRLGNLRLYKFDAPDVPGVGVIIISHEGGGHSTTERFKLSRLERGKGSKAGLPKSLVDMVDWSFPMRYSHVVNQILDYIVSNFSFKDLEIVPPACPVLVFHFQTIDFAQDHVHEIDVTPSVLGALGKRDYVSRVDDGTRPVPIAPPATEIVECYQSSDLCRLCGEGYPKEDEIVHKTRCNHIFHGTCISRYLLQTPRCPVCYTDLLPVDIRTLLFL